ncbi:MAG TPA: NADH-quinone oxidoreductase subunit K, partial [Candidatus Bathyarchaeota archaeon]|nr:NADH-quinone oxidoreductase subunit K [Candidatus Bathyarchaeota archaeon]HEX68687.1 NADH-quinone oxidoreductase subunit K [Candidatus Bathyarchaeota archaeon]
MIRLEYFVALAFALYFVGLYCLATKRNMIRLVLG